MTLVFAYYWAFETSAATSASAAIVMDGNRTWGCACADASKDAYECQEEEGAEQ